MHQICGSDCRKCSTACLPSWTAGWTAGHPGNCNPSAHFRAAEKKVQGHHHPTILPFRENFIPSGLRSGIRIGLAEPARSEFACRGLQGGGSRHVDSAANTCAMWVRPEAALQSRCLRASELLSFFNRDPLKTAIYETERLRHRIFCRCQHEFVFPRRASPFSRGYPSGAQFSFRGLWLCSQRRIVRSWSPATTRAVRFPALSAAECVEPRASRFLSRAETKQLRSKEFVP